MPFAATWMQLEILILSEVKPERERQIPYVTFMSNLKYGTNELIYKEKQTHRHREQTCGCQGGSGVVGRRTGNWRLTDANYYV